MEDIKTAIQYHQECKQETGITDSVAFGGLMGTLPVNKQFKQHVFCMSRKAGVQNEAGEIQRDVIKEQLSKYIDNDKVDALTEQCAVDQEFPEDTAAEMVKCYYQSIRKSNILW
ncbi:hypothetical protein NQ317_010898 [Molorchus minor]|uniref:Uncharacterized protein n=1 Tax=Molorchus minor TaxID=1323400 RepID=A0ABQ9JQC2_9CUCU|nr:hypothetical protein NQ317_010898 [Molorchus minor]